MQGGGHDGEGDAGPPDRAEGPRPLEGDPTEPDAEDGATWWLKKTIPKSAPRFRVPNITATSPEVSGTFEGHRPPIAAAKRSTTVGVGGRVMKSQITAALAR